MSLLLGVVNTITGRDLARHCRDTLGPPRVARIPDRGRSGGFVSAPRGRRLQVSETETPPDEDRTSGSSQDEGEQSEEHTPQERREAPERDERTVTESGGWGTERDQR
jgi:hypothetical protein